MLRHSISFEARKEFNPDNLYFMVKEWLLNRSTGSEFSESDFEIVRKNRDIEIKNSNENLKFLNYRENGLIFTSCDYKKNTPRGIYFTSIHIIKINKGTYVTAKLYTFSDSLKENPPANVPNIFKILRTKARGGLNGSLPILIDPLQLDYNSVIAAFSNTEKPLSLPIIFIDNKNSNYIDIKFLAKKLHGKAAVVGKVVEKLEITPKGGTRFLFFKRKKGSKNVYQKAEILYPDGERNVIETSGKEVMENKIIDIIFKNQNKQFSPIDYRYIYGKKESYKAINYRAPNFYCQSVFEIFLSLTGKEISSIENSLSNIHTKASEKDLLLVLEKIILFKNDRCMILKTEFSELKKIIGIIKISAEDLIKQVS